MKKIWIVISLIINFATDCNKTAYVEWICYGPAAWTSDGKVIFIKVKETWKEKKEDIFVNYEFVCDSTWLYEINSDGTGVENKGLLLTDLQVRGLSTKDDWAVFGDTDKNIWAVRRNCSDLQKIGEGYNPDLSNDAARIVYEKPNLGGIWIMDKNGENDHLLISDTYANPKWSPDDNLIACGASSRTLIVNLNGNPVKSYSGFSFIDWGPRDSNLIMCHLFSGNFPIIIFNIASDSEVDTLDFYPLEWSPDGSYFIVSGDTNTYITDRNGNNEIPIFGDCERN